MRHLLALLLIAAGFACGGAAAATSAAPRPRLLDMVDVAPALAVFAGGAPLAVDGRCVELGHGCPEPSPRRAG